MKDIFSDVPYSPLPLLSPGEGVLAPHTPGDYREARVVEDEGTHVWVQFACDGYVEKFPHSKVF